MPASPWNRRFIESTRGRIAEFLRTGPLTIDEIASKVRLTSNAVRAQMLELQADGLVRKAGAQATASKPSVKYALTDRAESQYSQLYHPFLAHLLGVLDHRMSPKQFDTLMRQVGRSLLGGRTGQGGTVADRANAASDLLNDLGALTRVARSNSHYVIRSHGCPLASATARHPETCSAVESLLAEFSGLSVTTCCERSERMRCCFEIGARPKSKRAAARRTSSHK